MMETVNTWGTNGAAVASMVPVQSHNALCAVWAKALDPPTIIYRSTTQWTVAEDARLLTLVKTLGMRWATVAKGMPCRTNLQCRKR
jgi:hypothetical protein